MDSKHDRTIRPEVVVYYSFGKIVAQPYVAGVSEWAEIFSHHMFNY